MSNALPTIEGWLEERSIGKPVGERYSFDEVSELIRLYEAEASLQTPSEKYGWVKASEPPKKQDWYMIKMVHENDLPEDGLTKEICEYVPGFPWPVAKGWTVIEWYNESTPIPILTPCGWVKVEDGLPESIEKVLTFEIDEFGDERIGISTYTEDGDWYAPFKTRINVKYWMPLPTKPNL